MNDGRTDKDREGNMHDLSPSPRFPHAWCSFQPVVPRPSNVIHEWALVTDYGETERWSG